MLWRRFDEQVERTRHRIDVRRRAAARRRRDAAAARPARGRRALGLGVAAERRALRRVAVLLLLAFVAGGAAGAEPVLPLWVFRSRVLNAAAAASLVVGRADARAVVVRPALRAGVLGHGAVVAGLALAAMTIGWPIAASTSGRFYLTIGFRATMLMGAAFAVAGARCCSPSDADAPCSHLALPCFVMGIGFGFVASPAVVAAQSLGGWQHRGVATGANMFARSVGSAVGVAVFGAIANAVVAARIGGAVPDLEHLPTGVLEPAIHAVFLASAAGLRSCCSAWALVMPRRVVEACHRSR